MATQSTPETKRMRLMRWYFIYHTHGRETAKQNGWDEKYWAARAEEMGCRFTDWDSEKQRYTKLEFVSQN